MRTRRFAALALGASICAAASAKPPTIPLDCGKSQGLPSKAERQFLSKQMGGGDTYVVMLTYIGKKPGDKAVDAGLRDCLAKASKLDGSKDILGTAWLKARASSDDDDDAQINPYPGLSYISYSASDRSVQVRKMEPRKK